MAPNNQAYDVPSYLQGDGSFADYTQQGAAYPSMAPPPGHMPERKPVSVDVGEFIRTRDALSSAYMNLSSSIDKAVKAYLDHTWVVIEGDSTLNVSYLTQPFDQLAHTAQLAQQAMQHSGQLQLSNGPTFAGAAGKADEVDEKGKRKKRPYKQRDPNAPKRPLTAYFRYLQEQRAPLGKELAEKAAGQPQKPGDLSKVATERWNSLPKSEQQPYRDAYNRALKDYEKEVVKYKEAGGKLSPAQEKALAAKAAAGEDLTEVAAEKEDDEEDAEAEDEEEVVAVEKVANEQEDDEDESSSDDSDDDDDQDEEEEVLAPPPPPPAKATPKSAMKKGKQPVTAPTPRFSSINPELIAQMSAAAGSSSPERKRKAPAAETAAPAETAPPAKKRGRKSNAEKVTAVADHTLVPTPAPVAQMQASAEPAKSEPSKKKQRKKKGGDA